MNMERMLGNLETRDNKCSNSVSFLGWGLLISNCHCHLSGSCVLGAELCVFSQIHKHLSCLCFSRCCFLGSAGVRNESSTGCLSPVWERDLFPLDKTLPCHRSSVEVPSSARGTRPRHLTSHLRRAPRAAAAGPRFCGAASADPRGTRGPMSRATSRNSVTSRKQAQFLLLGLLPFVLGFCFPGRRADGFWPAPVCACTYLSCR